MVPLENTHLITRRYRLSCHLHLRQRRMKENNNGCHKNMTTQTQRAAVDGNQLFLLCFFLSFFFFLFISNEQQSKPLLPVDSTACGSEKKKHCCCAIVSATTNYYTRGGGHTGQSAVSPVQDVCARRAVPGYSPRSADFDGYARARNCIRNEEPVVRCFDLLRIGCPRERAPQHSSFGRVCRKI